MQMEFDIYKQESEEQIIRKDEEIKDIKNDLENKEKIFQRLSEKKL